MKPLVWYWAIGCILVGMAMGQEELKCGTGALPEVGRLVGVVAVWPVAIGRGLVAGYKDQGCGAPWGIAR